MMYHRYIGRGDNAKSALLYTRVNKLGHTHNIDTNDITSRTSVTFVKNLDGISAAKMENILFNSYMYNRYEDKQKNIPTNTEYDSYKKLIIAFGKKRFNEIIKAYKSNNNCIAFKESEGVYRFVYFSKK